MHIISLTRNIRRRQNDLSTEVSCVMKKFIREFNSEDDIADVGDIMRHTLAHMPRNAVLIDRIQTVGLTLDLLDDGLRGVPGCALRSDRAMARFFSLLDDMVTRKDIVGLEDVVMACLAADSEIVDRIVCEGLRRPDGQPGLTVLDILGLIEAPATLIDIYALGAVDSFDLELELLLVS